MEAEQDTTRAIRAVTTLGLAVNLLLAAVKLAAGLVGNSRALVADSIHSLSDLVTDLAVLLGAGAWNTPPDSRHPYGHGRIETLVSLFIGCMLTAAGVGIAADSLASLHEAHAVPPRPLALAAALLSIVSKEWLYRWTVTRGRRLKSRAVIANAWHHRSDAFSSIPVAIAVAVAIVLPGWSVLDHIGAAVVSIFILRAAFGIMRDALNELIDSGVPEEVTRRVHTIARAHPEVRDVHAVRARRVGPGLQVDLHLLVNQDLSVRDGHAIAHDVRSNLLEADLDIHEAIVHLEPYPQSARDVSAG